MEQLSDLAQTLSEAEPRIREMMLWGVGDSQFWLWASAAIHFAVFTYIFSKLFSWIVAESIVRIFGLKKR